MFLNNGVKRLFENFYGNKVDLNSMDYYSELGIFLDLEIFVERMLSDLGNVRFELKQEYNDRKEYARAFETKSSIKKSHVEVMESSKFNKYFKFVELDNSVDLDKFSIIENELDVVFGLLPGEFANDHSFRVKKLGKHKALGLYFSGEKNLIIDVTSPKTFVHEYMHLLDYCFGEVGRLSDSEDFSVLYEMYKREVNHAVSVLPDEDVFKKSWESNNLRNREYYLSRREAFARMGEVYFREKLGKDISLGMEWDELMASPVYVTEDKFVTDIIEVFDKWFKN